jgi:hypothetical protein
MRTAVIRALVLTISLAGPIIVCLAQQAGGPKTLEDLLEATETLRTEGTVSRPRNGSQLPAVDKAWQQYEAAVQSATARLLSAIDDSLADARRQGDADAAAAFEMARESLTRRGVLPSALVPALRKESAAARQAYKAAATALEKTYRSIFQGDASMAELKDEWQLLDGMLDLANQPQLDSVWAHVIAGRDAATITFYSNGTIGAPDAPHTWALKDDVLTIRWENPEAPEGAWVDTCKLSNHGGSYSGQNQLGTGISGKRVQ